MNRTHKRNKIARAAATPLLVGALIAALVGTLAPFSAPTLAGADPAQNPNQNPSVQNPSNDPATPGLNAPVDESSLSIDEQVTLFESRIAALETNLEITSEDINTANAQLKDIREQIAQREKDLEETRAAYEESRVMLGRQARLAYREGSLGYLDILLSSKDIPSLLSKYDAIYRTAERQQSTQEQLAEHKEQLETELVELKKDELEARALEFDLEAKEIEMNHRKDEYQELLDAAKPQVIEEYEDNRTAVNTRDERSFIKFLDGNYEVEPGGVVETALAYRGIPYVWGGESKRGFDCSGLVLYVFRQHGVSLPHSSRMQARMGKAVTVQQLLPGDAVFFGSPVHHVGIYIGGGYFIHAPHTGDVVKVSKLSGMSDYVGARRYNWSPRVGDPK